MTWRSVFPWALIPAQTVTEPPPNWSCSATQTGAKHSFGILHTLARLLVKSTQNLDLSVNRTGAQSFWVQVTWSRAHAKRIYTWYRVNGTRIAGRLGLRPASCSRFLMVWVLTRTPVAFWKSLCKVVALSNRWRRAWTTRNRSWTSLVERSRPPSMQMPNISGRNKPVPRSGGNTLGHTKDISNMSLG